MSWCENNSRLLVPYNINFKSACKSKIKTDNLECFKFINKLQATKLSTNLKDFQSDICTSWWLWLVKSKQVRPVSINHTIMSLATSFLKKWESYISVRKSYISNIRMAKEPLNVVYLWSCIMKFQKGLGCWKKMNLTLGCI